MKTKYLLHGGDARLVNSANDLFFKEILKETSDTPRILLVHFASPPDRADLHIEQDTHQFLKNKEDRELIFLEATINEFLEQIAQADVVYLSGGTTLNILDTLRKFPNLANLFEGKTVAGESAGANALSTYCYSKSGGGVMNGLGILPVFMYPHYEKGDEEGLDLSSIPDTIERLFLGSFQFKVFQS